jgi:hypothetical protein
MVVEIKCTNLVIIKCSDDYYVLLHMSISRPSGRHVVDMLLNHQCFIIAPKYHKKLIRYPPVAN